MNSTVDKEALNRPGDCILFATADWDEPYWTNKQHTAIEMARLGWRVLYIESVGLRVPRAGSVRDWSRLWRRLRTGLRSLFIGPKERSQNVWVLSPLLIPAGHHRPLIGRINRWLLKCALGSFARRMRFESPLIWTYHPFMLTAIMPLSHGPILYHCVDDLGSVPGIDKQAFDKAEHALLATCTVVFATASSLQRRCRAINPNTHFLSNVADAAHFGRALQIGDLPPELRDIPEPRLVYHGVLSDFKVDFELMLASALLRPHWHWVVIGEQREGQKSELLSRLEALPNVHLLGYRSYAKLPEYLRGMQVGLLPSLVNEYTRSMFPMKFYEYLAAGLPVVSTPLDFTKNGELPGLETASGASGFVAAIEKQLVRGKLTAEEAKAAVGDNTWQVRMQSMIHIAATSIVKEKE